MAEQKKSIVEEALLDLKTITEALEANTKEILRSVAMGEIDGVVKESINEDMYDETDVDDAEEEDEFPAADGVEGGEEAPMSDDPSVDSELPAPVAGGDDAIDALDLGAEAGEDQSALSGGEDYEFDLTGASDDDVISVYKKLAGDDEIEIVNGNEVIIKDPASGNEFVVKGLGGEGAAATDAPVGGLDLDLGAGDDTMGIGAAPEVELEPEAPAVPAAPAAPADDAPEAPSTDDAPADDTVTGDDTEDEDDKLGEGVVFEIALGEGEDAELAEDIIRGKGHDTHLQTTTMDSGEIEGTKADKDPDSGDNLTGGFDDDAVSHANAEGPMVMGENEDAEDIAEGEEPIEEHIPKGNAEARRLPGRTDIGQPVGAGAKALEEATAKYNALLAEARKLKAENEEFKTSLKKFRQMLGETVVFNQNLTYVTKLFLEHSTTAREKQEILSRFDNQVTTIAESKKLYKAIASELSNKTPLTESVETKVVKEAASAVSGHLNESTAYVHPDQKRIQELMKRVENR